MVNYFFFSNWFFLFLGNYLIVIYIIYVGDFFFISWIFNIKKLFVLGVILFSNFIFFLIIFLNDNFCFENINVGLLKSCGIRDEDILLYNSKFFMFLENILLVLKIMILKRRRLY